MSLTHKPTDSASHQPPSHPIAEMYAHRTLDCVIELTRAISVDFVERPHHYRHVSADVADILLDLRTRTSFDPDWPNAPQRALISGSLLTSFFTAFADLRRAAIRFSEQGSVRDKDMLRQAFFNEVIALQSSLKTVEGQVLSIGNKQITTIFANATKVLKSEEVARAFGLPPALGDDWPHGPAFNGDGAVLLAEISKTLLSPTGTLSQQKFIVMQRVAYYGALTIAGILDRSPGYDHNNRIDSLIQSAYSWANALQKLLSNIDIGRAWKDKDYRQGLEIVERDMLPANPAGEIDLKGSGLDANTAKSSIGLAADTFTIGGDICCSTGDPCLQSTFTVNGEACCSTGDPCNQTNYCGTRIGFTCLCPSGGAISVLICFFGV